MHISEDVKAIAGSVLPVLFSARPEHSLYPLFLLLLHLCSIQPCPVDSCMLSVWQVHSGQRWNSCRRNLAAWSAPRPSCWVSAVTVVWKLTRLASFKCHGTISWNSGGLWGTHSLFFPFSTLVAPQPSALFFLFCLSNTSWELPGELASLGAECEDVWRQFIVQKPDPETCLQLLLPFFYWTNTDCDHWVKGPSGSHD